ncbi:MULTISPECIES: YgjV family protein [Sphingobium]|uniref:YgjV family protein n=1 Tax=Sphingobium TaxID=165695 RepID=UPI0013EE8B17|nr:MULTISPECIES: YgjV family protein [Sphingobium]
MIDDAIYTASAISILLGMIGLACVMTWPFLRCLRRVIVVQSVGAVAFTLQFSVLGASTAAVACGISLAQLLIALTVRDRGVRSALNIARLVTLLTLVLFTWVGIASLFAASGGIINMSARNQPSPMRMKTVFLIGSPFWLAHNIMGGALSALTVDLISVFTNMTGLYLASIEARKCLQGEVSDTVWRRVGILYGTFSGRRSGGAGTPGLSGPAAAQQECRA